MIFIVFIHINNSINYLKNFIELNVVIAACLADIYISTKITAVSIPAIDNIKKLNKIPIISCQINTYSSSNIFNPKYAISTKHIKWIRDLVSTKIPNKPIIKNKNAQDKYSNIYIKLL